MLLAIFLPSALVEQPAAYILAKSGNPLQEVFSYLLTFALELCYRSFGLRLCVVTFLLGFSVGVGAFVIRQSRISSFSFSI